MLCHCIMLQRWLARPSTAHADSMKNATGSPIGKMGALIVPRWLTALAAITAVTVITLNLKLLYNFFTAF